MSRHLLSPLAILSLVLGCSGEPASSAAGPEGVLARVEAGGLSATLEVTPERVAPGGEFSVRLALRNTTADSARLTLACPALAMFSVRDARGTLVDGSGNLPSGCLGVIATLRLAAGRDTIVEARGRAVELTYPPLGQRSLGRGTYAVVAEPTPIELNGKPVRLPELRRPLVVE
jgi:hypothetical protein